MAVQALMPFHNIHYSVWAKLIRYGKSVKSSPCLNINKRSAVEDFSTCDDTGFILPLAQSSIQRLVSLSQVIPRTLSLCLCQSMRAPVCVKVGHKPYRVDGQVDY